MIVALIGVIPDEHIERVPRRSSDDDIYRDYHASVLPDNKIDRRTSPLFSFLCALERASAKRLLPGELASDT